MEWERQCWVVSAFLPFLLVCVWPFLTLPWMALIAYYVYVQWIGPKYLDTEGRVVLVSGCDGLLGQAVALELDQRGVVVFAGCRDPESEQALELLAQASAFLSVIKLDPTNSEDVTDCVNRVKDYAEKNHIRGLWGLVHCSGRAHPGEAEWLESGDIGDSLTANCAGPASLATALLPLLRRAKGRIVLGTPEVSAAPITGQGALIAGAAALRAFADCLRLEMAKFQVKVSTVLVPLGLVPLELGGLEKRQEELSAAVAADYGPEYLAKARRHYLGSWEDGRPEALAELVVRDMVHAVLAKTSRASYKPIGLMGLAWSLVHSLLPGEYSARLYGLIYRALPHPARVG